MYNKNYDCVRSLIIRSPSGSSPVDFNVNLNIEAKDYDKIHLQLLSVNFDQEKDGSFPVDSTVQKKTNCFFVESNMGQMVFDTNQKRTFLGTVNVLREFNNPTTTDSTSNPIIELSSIPNGNYNFTLKDINGLIVLIDDGTDISLKAVTYVFQVYLSKNEIKRNQINI